MTTIYIKNKQKINYFSSCLAFLGLTYTCTPYLVGRVRVWKYRIEAGSARVNLNCGRRVQMATLISSYLNFCQGREGEKKRERRGRRGSDE
jgi:hypothetical protein